MSVGFDGAALLAALSERRVEYVIVGGFAVIAHGVIRTTKDLEQGGNFRLTTSYGALDVMQWLAGIDADQAYSTLAADAVEGMVAGIPVRVASLDALRRMKRAAGRPRDLDDLRQLDLAHGGDAPPMDPADVTVAVLNGTTVPGLAATIGDKVVGEGFRLGTVTNSFDQEKAESVVLYSPGAEREAAAVARSLDISQREAIDAESQALAGDATVVVVAGADQNQ